MNRVLIGKVSQKGQVVIPAPIRKALGLKKGSKVLFELNNGEITIKKLPTALDWSNLVKQIPVEDVKIDENGYFDPKKSPDFHDWMVNG
ncbi:AbrB/MazE/SpoVT family DNA-binding domain-containing protein [Lactobacillus melliventris]|uniref:AbrB/MazE/SpoVT family DNA-binding domain-containing protein n=1 Tax=Lactobacillus melliventris TaxID=1218507 RepID=UPI0015809099|nr:AbrB/MazE/SpoVT family DNA-binding domain-containing protein [Lactobacillus melliventris]NUE98520.1 AbrB/MazE/SpoVT family DNA-binding domain-containing protein [Lactobacillus melliventris]